MTKPDIAVKFTDKDIFVELMDGTKIAKRGHPGTPEAGTWVSLHPNYQVTSSPDHESIEVTYMDDKGGA